MFEGPVLTKSKLTDPSNDVSFTLDRERDRSRAAVLAKNRKFFLPRHLALLLGVTPFEFMETFMDPKTRVFQASDGKDFVFLACTVFD